MWVGHLDFARFLADTRKVEPEFKLSEDEKDWYDTEADGAPFGLVIEWSVFEHIYNSKQALENITSGLVQGGMFVTTTFAKEWTPELIEHYKRDSHDAEIAEQYLSEGMNEWVTANFEVMESNPNCVAKILVKR